MCNKCNNHNYNTEDKEIEIINWIGGTESSNCLDTEACSCKECENKEILKTHRESYYKGVANFFETQYNRLEKEFINVNNSNHILRDEINSSNNKLTTLETRLNREIGNLNTQISIKNRELALMKSVYIQIHNSYENLKNREEELTNHIMRISLRNKIEILDFNSRTGSKSNNRDESTLLYQTNALETPINY
ncbi:MAG: hypothetical protein AM1032_000353 [Mycoplasmataceae bacterium]|nr:MAG: hypothetical protein AM1032_000353 [Mycoplasmataceae bacterium]